MVDIGNDYFQDEGQMSYQQKFFASPNTLTTFFENLRNIGGVLLALIYGQLFYSV